MSMLDATGFWLTLLVVIAAGVACGMMGAWFVRWFFVRMGRDLHDIWHEAKLLFTRR